MSKASEYAERVKAASIKPDGFAASSRWVAGVSSQGYLELNSITIGPCEALKLADWIKETFGD